jgi:hypothetical protein
VCCNEMLARNVELAFQDIAKYGAKLACAPWIT